jgi:hypothetical protein
MAAMVVDNASTMLISISQKSVTGVTAKDKTQEHNIS